MIIKTLGLLFLLRHERPIPPTGSSSVSTVQLRQKQRLVVTTSLATTTPSNNNENNKDYNDKKIMVSTTLARENLVQDLETSRINEASNQTLATARITAPSSALADSAVGNAVATLLSGLGFLVNTVLGLKRYPLRQLATSFVLLLDLLAVIFDDGKFWTIFFNRRSLLNFVIMSRVIQDMADDRRNRVEIADSPPVAPNQVPAYLSDSVHYMKYATAAYGAIQIAANEAGDIAKTKALLRGDEQPSQASEAVKQKIANYIGVDVQDILYCSAPGGNAKLINHIVAIDRQRSELVLAIRGTYSVSGINTDLDAQGVPWYGGKAHGGFAVRAQQLLDNEETMQAMADGFEILQTAAAGGRRGKFKLVGHSLGAGIACLLNIAIQSNTTLFQNMYSELECYGYACPPAFALVEDVNSSPLYDNCKCYIHQQDTVPFLSVSAGQRLFETMIRVGDATKDFGLIKRARMAVGWAKIPKNVQDIVKQGSNDLDPEDGRLEIPAKNILWMRLDDNETNQYNYAFCNRTVLSMLSVNTDFPAMILDHFPPGYDKALTYINTSHVRG